MPKNPKFTIAKLFTIFWKNEIYTNLEPHITTAFLEILKQERTSKNYPLFQENLLQKSELETENSESEIQSSQNSLILNKILQGIVDLSINEISIFSLGHTKFKINGFYQNFELSLIKETKYFLIEILLQNIDDFIRKKF